MNNKSKPTATNEDGKRALVPKLRFPEFRGAQGWAIEKVGDLLDESRTPSLLNDPSKRITVRLHLQGVEHREHRGTESTESTNNFFRKSGQFIYGKQNIHKGAFGIIPKELDGFETSQDLPCFDFNSRCGPQWLYYNFASEAAYAPLELKMTGTGSKRLNEKTFLSLPIAVPPYLEQQKIAECLSSLDWLNAAQSRKLDALKTHKKGLMQQLFPREGETQPRLRFPEFQNAGEWEMKPLGKVAENLDNKRRPITSSDREAGDVPYYGASGIVDYVEGFIFNEDLLCVSEDGANLVARTYPIAFPISGKTWVNNHAHVLRFSNQCTQKFVEIYLNSIKLDDFITGMAQPKLNKAMLDKIPIPHPEVPEQQRIADCLSSLDDLIAAQTQTLEALKTHKQGLMQQLFPSPKEVEA